MSYWLGKHSVNESAHSVASKHQAAVSNEPDGATFGYLVECRCGWQSRVPRFIAEDKVREICIGTAHNHFNQHLMESVNKEIIWQNFSLPSEQESKKQDPSLEQPQEQPLAGQSVDPQVLLQAQSLATPLVKQAPVSSNPKNPKEAASPSLPQTGTSATPPVTTPVTPKPSITSPVSKPVTQVQPSVPTTTPTTTQTLETKLETPGGTK